MFVLVFMSRALFICIYIFIYIHGIRTHIYIYIFFFIFIIQTHHVFFRRVNMHICTRLCVCAFRCVRVCVHARVHACVRVWICVCLRLSLNLRVPVHKLKYITNQNVFLLRECNSILCLLSNGISRFLFSFQILSKNLSFFFSHAFAFYSGMVPWYGVATVSRID